jgi:hypothetical protein
MLMIIPLILGGISAKKQTADAIFEVVTAVKIQFVVFWAVAPCSVVVGC